MDWVRENFEAVAAWAVAVGAAAYAFIKGVNKNRSDHEQLRKEFNDHMLTAVPMRESFIETREKVRALDERMDERFAEVLRAIDDQATDLRTLNTTLIGVLKRGVGAIRSGDE